MKRLLGGVAFSLLCAVACGDDGATDPGPEASSGGEGGEGARGPLPEAGTAGTAGMGPLPQGGSGAEGGEPPTPEGGRPSPNGDAGAGGEGGQTAPAGGPVHGKLLRGMGPFVNARVVVGGQSTFTDDNGEYTFEDVPSSYDLLFVFPELEVVNAYSGLTTRSPITVMSTDGVKKEASIGGKLSGAGVPLAAGQRGKIGFFSSTSNDSVSFNLLQGQPSYSLEPINWQGPDQLPGLIEVLLWKEGATGPTEFTGFAQKTFTVQDGQAHGDIDGTVPATNLSLTDPAERTVEGTFDMPVTLEPGSSFLYVGGISVPLELGVGNFSLVLPEVEAAAFVEFAAANKVAGGTSAMLAKPPASGRWKVSLPKTQALLSPADDEASVTLATDFQWTNAPNVVSYVNWRVGDWTIYWTTAESSARLPDLSELGIEYPPGAAGSWALLGLGPAKTTDEFMEIETKALTGTSKFEALQVSSPSRDFNMAP